MCTKVYQISGLKIKMMAHENKLFIKCSFSLNDL